jgi:hypothetical protein
MHISELPDFPVLRQVQQALWRAKDVRGAAVMVGAGFSKFANLASANGRAAPLWRDFEKEMRHRLGDADVSSDPLKLAQQYQAALGRHALDGLIREFICDSQWMPGELHSRLLGLPWADVLTTNWDTLLERTPSEPDKGYEVVRVISDIARTRAPRIVKLHGSLPSHEPFIFTSEDFRTYPRHFAPFVNLAQQVLLENELCLVGFSGDDPNFLQWSGWVRDQLGASARKIRLIGVLNLSPSRRQVLEQSNVSPVDLAPLVSGVEDIDKHAEAMRIFLDGLWEAKPKPNHAWSIRDVRGLIPVHDAKPKTEPEQFVAEILQKWRAERESYPGWVIAPSGKRAVLDHFTPLPDVWRALPNTAPKTRAWALYEILWRIEKTFAPIDTNIVEFADEILKDTQSDLTIAQIQEMRVVLLRSARRRRDWLRFEEQVLALQTSTNPDIVASVAYEKALRCRDHLDFAGLEKVLGTITGDDPMWSTRRAALQREVGQEKAADDTLVAALQDIRNRRTRDRDSVWLLSREAWAAWLVRCVRGAMSQRGDEYSERWPIKYRAADCDPWDEINHIDRMISQESTKRMTEAETIEPRFDPGTYRDRSRTVHISNGYKITSLDTLIGLGESVGVPDKMNFYSLLSARFESSLEILQDGSPEMICCAVQHLQNASDGLIDRYFGRVDVARMPSDLVEALGKQILQAIEYAQKHFAEMGWVTQTATLTELLSRLVVRFPSEKAVEIYKWAMRLADDSRWVHWWLFEPLEQLLTRSLHAVHPLHRSELALLAMQLKLPHEKEHRGPERAWPELAFEFKAKDFAARDSTYAWTRRISDLIEAVRTQVGLGRSRAVWRLSALHDAGVLTEEEQSSFATALWSRREGHDGFPEDSELYANVFLRLPEPTPGLAREVFERKVVKPLTEGRLSAFALSSLGSSVLDRNTNAVQSSLKAADALAILDACLTWTPRSSPAPDIFGHERQGNEEIKSAMGQCLSNAVFPVLSAEDLGAERTEGWVAALKGDSVPELTQTAGEFARIFPSRLDEAVSFVRRRLASSEPASFRVAIWAINRLTQLHERGLIVFPPVLASDVSTLCASRSESGLLMGLGCARHLVRQQLLGDDDKGQLVQALEFLLAETNYQGWDKTDIRTRSLSLIRQECVLLANALKQAGEQSQFIDGWLAVTETDTIPEVRFVLANASVEAKG